MLFMRRSGSSCQYCFYSRAALGVSLLTLDLWSLKRESSISFSFLLWYSCLSAIKAKGLSFLHLRPQNQDQRPILQIAMSAQTPEYSTFIGTSSNPHLAPRLGTTLSHTLLETTSLLHILGQTRIPSLTISLEMLLSQGSDYPQNPFPHGYLLLSQMKMRIPHPPFPIESNILSFDCTQTIYKGSLAHYACNPLRQNPYIITFTSILPLATCFPQKLNMFPECDTHRTTFSPPSPLHTAFSGSISQAISNRSPTLRTVRIGCQNQPHPFLFGKQQQISSNLKTRIVACSHEGEGQALKSHQGTVMSAPCSSLQSLKHLWFILKFWYVLMHLLAHRPFWPWFPFRLRHMG
ncbi:hypothetical protein VP01_1416g1 [Puccinia sorghi]|uniref:Uncharacterized protein n=1 Tax=Puccinia sorghi TaxID=27349 RepID=A0A0L6VKY2_9BASI|nr:hypothetical protein VP01_1416g1 [Puccinia sorghi]